MTLIPAFCSHPRLSGADERGQAVCQGCGAVVQAHLTPWVLMDAAERIRRDHGPFGSHSMACVETDAGWCCASGCSLR